MKNPATIPSHIMRHIEDDMARAADMQDTRRHVVKHHGAAEWRWLSTTDTQSHKWRRKVAADAIRRARKAIRENGYEVWYVCAIARDPEKFAFCDGSGATSENIPQ